MVNARESGKYLYEPDPAVTKGELLPEPIKELKDKVEIFQIDNKRLMLTSNTAMVPSHDKEHL
jgi:hypothetical protein